MSTMTIELEGSIDCLASSIGDYILTLCATIIGECSALVISDSAVFSTGSQNQWDSPSHAAKREALPRWLSAGCHDDLATLVCSHGQCGRGLAGNV